MLNETGMGARCLADDPLQYLLHIYIHLNQIIQQLFFTVLERIVQNLYWDC